MALTADQLAEAEVVLDGKFYSGENWGIEPYLSPSEKTVNKPILPVTSNATGRMGHPRIYPGPDTALVEAYFFSVEGNRHSGTFTNTDDALRWLLRQEQGGRMVQP